MSEKRRDTKGRILHEGEYQEKDGSYTYRFTDRNKKRKKLTSWRLTEADVTPSGKKHKKSLREQEKELQVLLYKGVYNDGTNVCELVERYIETKTSVSHNTRAMYKTVQRMLANDPFGRKTIDKIKFSDAKLFLIGLQTAGRSFSSIHNIRSVLRPAFQMAVEDELLPYNPFSFELSKILINDSVQRQSLTSKQERDFLQFVKNDQHFCKYYEGIYILFKTGIRISEFCGLTISDIDFKEHTLNIDHQLHRTQEGVYIIVPTKTNAGTRLLPIKKDVEECFQSIFDNRIAPKTEPMVDGRIGFLYLDKNNMPMISMHWEKYFQHICQKYNKIYKVQMPKVTPHVCRHTYCTNMVKSGISAKTLQYLMGHSSIEVTLNVYTHIGYSHAKEEINKLEDDSISNAKKAR
ncbi:MAG: site-specific integrase [Eubacterium sp.]|nr:site-specific integrase [Eubacterium sp.]